MFGAVELFKPGADTDALKTKFAVALLRNPDRAFQAGCEVFGEDTGKALYVAHNWLNDDFVAAEQRRLLKDNGARSFLPSKEDAAREVWRMATDDRTPVEDKRRFMDLFCEIMGYKERPQQSGINVNVTQNRVMVVNNHGSDDDWEQKARAQQHRLANGDATDVPSRTIQ
jgi:hypothetical protein